MEIRRRVMNPRMNHMPVSALLMVLLVFLRKSLCYESGSLGVMAFAFNKGVIRKKSMSRLVSNSPVTFSHRCIYALDNKRGMNTEKGHQLMAHRVGIIGGGLAGLSTAYHILKKSPSCDITIIDPKPPGTGGASSVAGGLLHPLSPKGKLAYKGFEGLASSNELVKAASEFEDNVVLRNNIYRIATTEAQAIKFRETAAELPELATWLEKDSSIDGIQDRERWEADYFETEKDVLGALRLSGECKVVHMRSYLKGLWAHCKSVGSGSKTWEAFEGDQSIDSVGWKKRLDDFDSVIFSAGSGLFQSSLVTEKEFPITLVRGQSVEMTIDNEVPWNAVLCGKYASPLLEPGRVLIGATHEFKEVPFTSKEVEIELKERSYHFMSNVWDNGKIDRVTTGYRVQSNRGPHGRLPIVGKLEGCRHKNCWIFTGLSGRGMLYHGIYGDYLTNLILGIPDDDNSLGDNVDWWRS